MRALGRRAVALESAGSMIVLLTNDDGVESPGLKALAETLSPEHEVWIVAPDGERSGTSHAITLRNAVRIKEVGERRYSCAGTPADCVLFSFLGAIPVKPAVVISGINLGPNLGTDIIYSGTVAAARQAALMGHPAVAVSLADFRPPLFFNTAADFVAKNLETMIRMWNGDHFLNINVPNSSEPVLPAVITHPSRRTYHDKVVSFVAPTKEVYYFLESRPVEAKQEEGSDWGAVSQGSISVSPIYLHPLNNADYLAYERVEFRM